MSRLKAALIRDFDEKGVCWINYLIFYGHEQLSFNRVPKCDVTKILFLEYCSFGLKF